MTIREVDLLSDMAVVTIDTTHRIAIDGQDTGLAVKQSLDRTVVYTPEPYCEHPMPHPRYSTSHITPSSGVPGRRTFAEDIHQLMLQLRQ